MFLKNYSFSLKFRIVSLTLLTSVAVGSIAIWVGEMLFEQMMQDWAIRLVQHQTRYNQLHVLQPISREIDLVREMVSDPAIVAWSADPDEQDMKSKALAVLDAYRQRFRDHQWFLAMAKDGHYYYNNKDGEFSGREFRYVLQKSEVRDLWFFTLLRRPGDFDLNVNRDRALGITNIWIDMPVRDKNGKVLAIAGTGFDLAEFINNLDLTNDDGGDSLLVNKNGAIQIDKDETHIDYASLTHDPEAEKTIFSLITSPHEAGEVAAGIKRLLSGEAGFETVWGHIKSRKFLIAMAPLRDIGWVEITLLDFSSMRPANGLLYVAATTILGILILLIAWSWLLQSLVIRPMAHMHATISQLKNGQAVTVDPDSIRGREMRELFQHFLEMTRKVQQSQQHLEAEVKARTVELEELKDAAERKARVDPLTGLANRLAFYEVSGRLEKLYKTQGAALPISLVMMDIDYFKRINDNWGHVAGDVMLKAIADLLLASVRDEDLVARLGGEEFAIILSNSDAQSARSFSERLRLAIRDQTVTFSGERLHVTASFGIACAQLPELNIDAMFKRADMALYRSKAEGRDRVTVADDAH